MSVRLFVPGLQVAQQIPVAELNQIEAPLLRRVLSRSVKQSIAPVSAINQLYGVFNPEPKDVLSIPVAALTAVSDGLDANQGYWMRADPVYLYPDTHSLILQDPKILDVSVEEAQQLHQLIAPLTKDYAVELHMPNPSRWYLQFDEEVPDIQCTSVYDAIGKPANTLLPKGDDRRRWHTLFNEIQMLLNQAEVNLQREQAGKLPINSLWFWGEGRFPNVLAPTYNQYFGEHELLSTLCRLSGKPYSHVDALMSNDIQLQEASAIFIDRLHHADRLGLVSEWLQAVVWLETQIITPLIKLLVSKSTDRIVIDTGQNEFRIMARQLKAFWKPVKPLSALLQST